jgi:hypothetical protein
LVRGTHSRNLLPETKIARYPSSVYMCWLLQKWRSGPRRSVSRAAARA